MLQFMDCSNCGKRVRTTAHKCHHCQQPIVSAIAQSPKAPRKSAQQHDDSIAANSDESHNALSGGYDPAEDDFDYDEYLAEEFPEQASVPRRTVKPWVWITAWLLVAATLLPFFYYFLING